MDGQEVFPDAVFDDFKIVNNGRFVRFETDFGLAVESDGRWMTVIKVPAEFASKVNGLCGGALVKQIISSFSKLNLIS